MTDSCNTGSCDEGSDECVPVPLPNGTSCDDLLFCTVSESCTDGACGGAARDCTLLSDQCNEGVCDDAIDQCVQDPVEDTRPCEDGLYCTVSDACVAGSCVGTARNCSHLTDQCNEGTCNEPMATCIANPVIDGTSCDDDDPCTEDDMCVSGECDGAEIPACIPCDGQADCDDGNACTEDACVEDVCVFTPGHGRN